MNGHEVGQNDDEREDQLDGQALPGAQRWTIGNRRLKIALVSGNGDTAKLWQLND